MLPRQWSNHIGIICALLTCLTAITVVLGWFTQTQSLIQIRPTFAPMQFNTALCFLFSGAAFLLLKNHLVLAARVFAGITLMISGVTLCQYLFDFNSGLDELFFDHYVMTKTSHPGRMAPNTALSFVLVSGLLLLACHFKRLAQHALIITLGSACVLLLAIISTLGYVTGIESSYGWGNYTRMAVHTSLAFIALGVSLGVLAFQYGPKRNRQIRVSLFIGILFLSPTLSFWQAIKSHELKQIHTDIAQLNSIINSQFIAAITEDEKRLRLLSQTDMLPSQIALDASYPITSLWYFSDDVMLTQVRTAPGFDISENAIVNHLKMLEFKSISYTPFSLSSFSKLAGKSFIWLKMQSGDATLYASVDLNPLIDELKAMAASHDMGLILRDPLGFEFVRYNQTEIERVTLEWQALLNGYESKVVPTQQYYDTRLTAVSDTLLFTGLAICLLIASYVYNLVGQSSLSKRLAKENAQLARVTQRLNNTKEQMALAADVSGLGVWQMDIQSNVIEYDARIGIIFGFEHANERIDVGEFFKSVLSDERSALMQSLTEKIEQSQDWRAEFTIKKVDEKRTIRIFARKQANQSPPTLIGGALDVTEQKRIEEQLRDLKNKADQANHAKSEFLANMSHEIRTPMNGVIGIADLLQNTELNDLQKEYVQLVISSAQSLLNILNDILDLSKIEANQLELEAVSFSLDQKVGDILKGFAPAAHKKGIELTHCIEQDVPDWVHADPVRIGQLLFNLIGNALKFTEQGEVSVLVRHKAPLSDDKVLLEWVIKDTGIGIEQEKQSAIFLPFEQADVSTTREYGGTGLGLAIVGQLVKLMGGNIELKSQLHHGSEFIVTLPIHIGKPDPNIEKRHTPWRFKNAQLSQKRALLVTPNPTSGRWLFEMLNSWECQVVQTTQGSEALKAWANQTADFVIIDNPLPDTDVLSLIDSLQLNSPEKVEFTVLLNASDTDITRTLEKYDYISFLVKPVKQSEVFNLLFKDRNLSLSEQQNSLQDQSSPLGINRLRILVAEDNPINQRVVGDILASRGHRLDIVENGSAALQQIKNTPYDLVLMDVQMPVMDGLEATRLIREYQQNEYLPRIPIIGLTAKAIKGDREQCLAAGMDDYLTKPVDAKELIATVECFKQDNGSWEPTHSGDYIDTAPTVHIEQEMMFDYHHCLEITGNNSETLQTVVSMTIDLLPQNMADIDAAISHQNAQVLETAVHKLKGTVANVAKRTLVQQLNDMELLAREAKLTDCELMWQPTKDDVNALLKELKSWFNTQTN